MSNTGQGVLTVVGTVVGAYFGYPQLGFALGSLAGQFLFPTQLPALQGSRLADITSTQATVGAPIPRAWGRVPLPGNILYQSDLREVVTSTTLGGKGGPTQSQDSSSYYQDFMIGLSDRPDSRISAIKGIRRIRANGKWIYDIRPQLDAETDDAYSQRIAANALLVEIMTIHLGTADQLPDPTIEADLGVGNVPAYRDRAAVMFTNWRLKEEDGIRIPAQWLFEVYTEGDEDISTAFEYSNEVLFPWLHNYPENPLNNHTYTIAASGTGTGGVDPIETTPINSVFEGLGVMETYRSKPLGIYQGVAASVGFGGEIALGVTDTMGGNDATVTDAPTVYVHYNAFAASGAYTAGSINSPEGPNYCVRIKAAASSARGAVLTDDGYTQIPIHTDTGNKIYLPVGVGSPQPPYWDHLAIQCDGGDADEHTWLLDSIGVAFSITRVPRAPDDPTAPRAGPPPPRVPGAPDFFVVDGKLTRAGSWTLVTGTWKVLQAYLASRPVKYPLNPARPSTHPDYSNAAFWQAAYADAVLTGEMPAGLTYGVDYPHGQSFGYVRTLDYSSAETSPVSIATVLRDNFLEAGLAEQDFDVSDLETSFITGFVRTRPMTARAVAESLRPVGFFDVVESEGKIKCIRRGKPSVDTLKESDLGAYEGGSDRVTALSATKKLEMDIPRVVRLHFISDDRDLDADEVPSPVAVDTDTVQELDMEIVVVLTTEQAKQIAETTWADFRMSANTHQTTVDQSFSRLEPADCINVPLRGRLERMRILDIDDRTTYVRQLSMVRDDDGIPLGAAIGRAPPNIPPVLSITSPVEMLLLDLPALRDDDDDAGIYVAGRPYITGAALRGAQIFRSADGGGNYARAGGISTAGTIGVLVVALAEGPSSIWDDGNEIIIDLQSGALENRTEEDVLNGANAAAIGLDGRWEIVQFRNADIISGSRYRLTGLLRGRRGTEGFIGSSVAGDRFVMVSTGQISRLPLELQFVGRELLYKCAPSGTNLDSATAQSFTGEGVALKPFSPVDLQGAQSVDGTWTITWIRRSRLGEAWASYTDTPLAEEREDYELEILRDGAVVRTISTSTASATYTIDQQMTDFGELQDLLSVVAYQISTAVGRGTGAAATLSGA